MTNPEVGEAINPSTGTGAGMIAFLDYAIKRKEMVEATAVALRTGCKKVLEIEDDSNTVDLKTADVDDIIRRFRNGARGQMKDRSIDQYEQRFRQTVDMYRKWLVDDPTWRPAGRAPKTANGSSTARAATPRNTVTPVQGGGTGMPRHDEPAAPGMITYPIPIRPGVHGRIVLPEDLTTREAQRIAQFVAALAFEEQLALPPGSSAQ